MTYDEYFSEERDPWIKGELGIEVTAFSFEYINDDFWKYPNDEDYWKFRRLQIYFGTDAHRRLLFSNAIFSRGNFGYLYVGVGGNLFRVDQNANSVLLYSGPNPIYQISAPNQYYLLFHDGEMAYRMFLPTGQVDTLCEVDSTRTVISSISNTDYEFETPDPDFLEFEANYGAAADYISQGLGEPYHYKVYSWRTRNVYPIDPKEKREIVDNGIALDWYTAVRLTYLDRLNADLEKMGRK